MPFPVLVIESSILCFRVTNPFLFLSHGIPEREYTSSEALRRQLTMNPFSPRGSFIRAHSTIYDKRQECDGCATEGIFVLFILIQIGGWLKSPLKLSPEVYLPQVAKHHKFLSNPSCCVFATTALVVDASPFHRCFSFRRAGGRHLPCWGISRKRSETGERPRATTGEAGGRRDGSCAETRVAAAQAEEDCQGCVAHGGPDASGDASGERSSILQVIAVARRPRQGLFLFLLEKILRNTTNICCSLSSEKFMKKRKDAKNNPKIALEFVMAVTTTTTTVNQAYYFVRIRRIRTKDSWLGSCLRDLKLSLFASKTAAVSFIP